MLEFKGNDPHYVEIHYLGVLVGHLQEENGKYKTTFYCLYFIEFPVEVLEAIVAKKNQLEAEKQETK